MKKGVKVLLVLSLVMVMLIVSTGCQAVTDLVRGREVITIICPYGVGGTADAIARKFALVAGELFPQYEFVVQQRTGGDGFVGKAYFDALEPGTKTLLQLGYGVAYRHAIGNTYGTEEVPFDLANFIPIATIDDRTWILYSLPGVTLEQILEQAIAGDLKMSGGNPLSDPHLVFGSFLAIKGGTVTVVPYEGGAAQKQGLLNGEVDVFVGTTQAGMQEVTAGQMIPLLAFSQDGFDGFVGPDGAISTPGLVNNRPAALDPAKDYSGSILPAGGFIAVRTGASQEWIDKVEEISRAVWNDPDFHNWIDEIGLNRFEVYGDDAQAHLDEAMEKALNAFRLLQAAN